MYRAGVSGVRLHSLALSTRSAVEGVVAEDIRMVAPDVDRASVDAHHPLANKLFAKFPLNIMLEARRLQWCSEPETILELAAQPARGQVCVGVDVVVIAMLSNVRLREHEPRESTAKVLFWPPVLM